MADLPGSVLFACTTNAVRSPMAEGIMKSIFGHLVYIDSAGVRREEINPFAVAVMDEIGIELSRHRSMTIEDLEDPSFDLVVSLSPQAQHHAVELTRTMACEVEYWNTFDATVVVGNRETRLAAFREVRDGLIDRVKRRFPPPPSPQV